MISLAQESRLATETISNDAQFIVAVARALHLYGTPSHQLEETLAKISRELNLESQFLVTPTSIMMSVGEVPKQLTFLERVDGGETNLEKLNQLSLIIRRVVAGKTSTQAAVAEVKSLNDAPSEYGTGFMTCAYTLACGTSAIFFGGGWLETAIASVVGLALGLFSLIAERHPRIAGVVPVFGALFATVVSRFATNTWPPGVAFIGALGGLIVLVPGYTLTVAMNEIAHRHLVSGTARVTGALVTFLQMGLGLALGSRISDALFQVPPAAQAIPVPTWAFWSSAVLASIAFTVLFHAHWRDAPAILIGSLIALLTSQFGAESLGPVTGVALSAWLLGCFSNAVARYNERPAATTLVPGLLVLVPGSFGFRSVQALLNHDVVSGVEIGFSTTMTAMALVTGLFLANLTVSPRSVTF
ncbi:MAG: threonine/serine exporter ThrE family protein [Planctomycetaceae bacterium]